MKRPRIPLAAVLAAVLGVVLALAGTGSAYAASGPHGDARVVGTDGGTVRISFSGVDLPPDAQLDPKHVRVTFDGKRVAASASGIEQQGGATERRVVLVIDTSGSMAGAGIDTAKQAALDFVAAMPRDVEIGIESFSDRVHRDLAPTTSHRRARRAIARLQAGGETSLYDAVQSALVTVGTSGERTLVLLSDGGDTRSHADASAVVEDVRRSGARLDVIAFHTQDAVSSVLQQFADAGHGSVYAAADTKDLASAFTAAARSLVTQLLVTAEVPASMAGRTVDAHLAVGSTAGRLTADVTVRLPAVPGAPGTGGGGSDTAGATPATAVPGASKTGLWIALLAVFLGLGCLGYAATSSWLASRSDGTRTKRLAELYTVSTAPRAAAGAVDDDASKLGTTGAMRSALSLAERALQRPGFRERVELRLARANVALRPNEWLIVLAGCAFVVAIVGWLVVGNLLGFVLGGLLGYLAPAGWLAYRGHRRLAGFAERLPESLQLVSGSLSSGFSLPQAIDGVVREGQEPVSVEFGKALAEARLGVPIEDALERVAERMDSTDFRWVVMAIRIQREVGGNLSELLSNTAAMMRERARIHRQVRALSAEGRLSAYILVGLPIVMSMYLLTFRRPYIRLLYTDPVGIVMLVGAVSLVCAGALWMRKLVRIEV